MLKIIASGLIILDRVFGVIFKKYIAYNYTGGVVRGEFYSPLLFGEIIKAFTFLGGRPRLYLIGIILGLELAVLLIAFLVLVGVFELAAASPLKLILILMAR